MYLYIYFIYTHMYLGCYFWNKNGQVVNTFLREAMNDVSFKFEGVENMKIYFQI